MVALLMSPKDPAVNVIDRHIKLFLSCCHRFCQLYYNDNKVPFWATTSNFPSLLNIAAQIKKYGPLRWYWEGTRERYIQTVKKVLVSMRKTTSYFVRKMIIMQKLTTIAWLKETLRKTKGRSKTDYTRMYFRYESLQEIREKFEKGGILSGLTIKIDAETTLAGHFWIVYGKKGSIMNIVPIVMERDEETSKVLCGMNYHKYLLDEDNCVTGLRREEIEDSTSDYCVLLPYNEKKEKDFEFLYGVVFSDWEIIDGVGNKNLPVLCPKEFAVDVKSMI